MSTGPSGLSPRTRSDGGRSPARELARHGAPRRRSRRPSAACRHRPPRRSGTPTPPGPLAGARDAQLAEGRSRGSAVVRDGSHRPRGAGPSTAPAPGPTCLPCARGEPGAPAWRCGRAELSPSCAAGARGSPNQPRTSASRRPRPGLRPAPSSPPPCAPNPRPPHRPVHRPPRGGPGPRRDRRQWRRPSPGRLRESGETVTHHPVPVACPLLVRARQELEIRGARASREPHSRAF